MTAHDDAHFIRIAIDVAQRAREHGNHPFGAILVDSTGEVLLVAENTLLTENDVTNHAETNLVRLAGHALPRAALRATTLYTSCEPCPMCSGAIYWAGIGRVVYGLSEAGLYGPGATEPGSDALLMPCRDIFAAGGTPTEVVGPMLEDEASEPHRGFWRS